MNNNNNIITIQETLMKQLERVDKAVAKEIQSEVARSNSVSQIANTFIKSCNLLIRVEEVAEKTHKSRNELSKNLGITNDKK